MEMHEYNEKRKQKYDLKAVLRSLDFGKEFIFSVLHFEISS